MLSGIDVLAPLFVGMLGGVVGVFVQATCKPDESPAWNTVKSISVLVVTIVILLWLSTNNLAHSNNTVLLGGAGLAIGLFGTSFVLGWPRSPLV